MRSPWRSSLAPCWPGAATSSPSPASCSGSGALTRGYVLFVAIALYLAAWRSDDLARAYRALLAAATTMLVVCAAFAIVAPDALAASI